MAAINAEGPVQAGYIADPFIEQHHGRIEQGGPKAQKDTQQVIASAPLLKTPITSTRPKVDMTNRTCLDVSRS